MKYFFTTFSLFLCIVSSTAQSMPIYTFTPSGATGTTGPTQLMVDTEYTGTTLDGDVTSNSGIQQWTVPTTGTYLIEAFGAQGYGDFGGRGAHISGEIDLTAGDILKILVGQEAPPYPEFPLTTFDRQFGGGGGSFVTLLNDTPLVVAGGGGGNHETIFVVSADGQLTESGAAGVGSTSGAGGINGFGGQDANSANAGGGLLGDGAGGGGGQAFVNGGVGGTGVNAGTTTTGFGGFGAGGGTSSWNNFRGGGGGGYSGGGGGTSGGTCCSAGGGGGSFNVGANPVNLAGVQLNDGLVRITFANALSPTNAVPVPTLSQWALFSLVLLLLMTGLFNRRFRF